MPNSLPEWLTYIETLHPKTMDLGLDRVQQVAKQLGVQQFACPVITVAGTNGKGSCVAFLETILQTAGYRTGSYSSPHLLRFTERAHINGAEISESAWSMAFAEVEKARGSLPLTYFEMTTLAALLLFKQADLQALILEVGLGGRLDAVNVIDPDVAVITTIAMDHMEWLGDNLEAIGHEKAGIFRVGKPAVCGDITPPNSILARALHIQAPLYCAKQQFMYHERTTAWDWQGPTTRYEDLPLTTLPLQNAATALMALTCLQDCLPVARKSIDQGLLAAHLPGRFQQLHQPVLTILDVAHNPAASTLLAKQLQAKPFAGKTLAVVSILADKAIAETLAPLLPCVDNWYVAGLELARGTSSENMAKHLRALGVDRPQQAPTVAAAYQQAVAACGPADRVLVFGSFHTVAEVSTQICL